MTATAAGGLTTAEAAERLARSGPNRVDAAGRAWTGVLLRQLRSPLLALLLVAAVVSVAVDERLSGTIILAIVGLSVGLAFVNEYRSERALVALRARTGRRATVLRDGVAVELPAAEVVPGDVCLVQAGDVVPADLELLDAAELSLDESALTGEAFPAEKHPGEPAWSGTVVRSGHGVGAVTATGAATRIGAVATALGERQPPTAFQRGLTSFAALLARVTVALTISILVANAALGRPLLDSVLFSLAIAVGLTPQLLPAIVTVSLATGAQRMARRSVLVKRLVAIEDLGDADVLFADKTGTLTAGEIRLAEAVDAAGRPDPHVLRLALLCSELDLAHGGRPVGSTLDLAVWDALDPAVARAELEHAERVATIPFSFERRRVSVVEQTARGRRLLCKGAAEEVLARCADVPPAVPALLEQRAAAGSRVLALATREVAVADAYSEADERGLAFAGLLVFADPVKADAAESVARLRRLGIELKVLTGDHERTAAHVCREVGLPVRGVVRGPDLVGLADEELQRLVAETTIFARVGPDQKAALVRAAQRNGEDVAFLGDGVNDAVALCVADVGISVDSAADVARDAADVVLLEKSLHVLADGVVEGRRIFANTMKYVLMGTSSNFGNMFSAAGASLFLSFLPMLPGQILLNNLLYDCSELTIPTDRVDEELLGRPEHWDTRFIRSFMLAFGPISSLYDFLTFGVMLWVFDADAQLFRSGWFVESLATQAFVVFAIRTQRVPFWRSRPSRPLLLTTLGVVALAIALPFSPLASPLGFRALPASFLAILLAMVVTYVALVEAGKALFFRGVRGRRDPGKP
jgi:Mg2+-importing ATPase